jgi:hypothetical protein
VPPGNRSDGNSTSAAEDGAHPPQAAGHCACIGNTVIVDGILVAKHYRDMLRQLLTDHHGQTHAFYLDVPQEETLRSMRRGAHRRQG